MEELKNKFKQIKEILENDVDQASSELEKIKPNGLSGELKYDYYYLAGNIHYERDEYDDAIKDYDFVLKKADLDSEDKAKIYKNLASIYNDKELYGDSIKYANKSLELAKNHKTISGSLQILATSYMILKEFTKSIDCLLRVIDLYGHARNEYWSKYMIESSLASLCFAYWKLGNEEKSEYYFEKLTSIPVVNSHELSRAYLCKAHRFYEKRQWKEALDHYNKALSLINDEAEKEYYQKYINDCKGWLAKRKSDM